MAWWVSGLLQNHLANGVGVQTGWQMEGNVRPLEFSFLIEATSHGDGGAPVEGRSLQFGPNGGDCV